MIAAIVYATDQGLGRLAYEFYTHGLIDRVMIKHHPSRTTHYDWYEDRANTIDDLLYGADTFLCFETPFYMDIVKKAKARGIKTVIMPMYECTTDAVVKQFDKIINPSLLDQEVFPQGEFIPVPVDVKYRHRKKANVFVHNAGHGGLGGRNGTNELLQAMKYVESPIHLIVRSQSNEIKCRDSRVEIINKTVPFKELWNRGDVFVFPEKFNGLSLPIQEAFASGMVVMTTDRFPNNTYLPQKPLIPVSGYTKEVLARPIEIATIDPKDIAAKIDEFYNCDINRLSTQGGQYAKNTTWEKLIPVYKKALT